MAEGTSRAGAIEIKEATIVSGSGRAESVVPQIIEINLYEDIFEHFLTGKILIRDCQALAQFFPFVGHEYLRLTVATPGLDESVGEFSREFFIYSVSDKIIDSQTSAFYTLAFISKEAIVDMNVRLSKTFRGTSDVMLAELLGEKGLNVDQDEKAFWLARSSNNFTFCANWWNPTKCINYITEHSLNGVEQPDFLFYETKNGFIFESLDTLINPNSDAVVQSFRFDRYARSMGEKDSADLDITRQYQTVADMEIKSGYDYIDRLRNGYYGGSTISFNPLTQQYTHRANQVAFETTQHLNKYAPYPENTPMTYYGFVRYAPTVYNNFENSLDNSDMVFGLNRRIILERLNTTRALIKVHGRLDYSIGQMVNLTIPSATQTDDDENLDTLASGKYLIGSIRHSMTQGVHEATIELLKDSYIADIEKSVLKQ